ncbi:hypothetical protein ABZV77_02045 [Streptomyces sp. NPDC004732]|uniref:hypothetical protein n=1 Tax=Streptomyces sp. NPDC004732 TaxID=3154290 RepID=UPI0033A82561
MARARLSRQTTTGRVVLSSCGALVALALIAGGYYWWGGPREHRMAQQVLDEACEGVLPSRELRDVLGDGPFEKKPGRVDVLLAEEDLDGDRAKERTVTCGVTGDGAPVAGGNSNRAEVQVTVQSVPQRRGDETGVDPASVRAFERGPTYPKPAAELPPVGLGNGWRGLFTTAESDGTSPAHSSSATVTTLLDCAGDRGGLLVTVDAKDDDVTLDDPRRRAAFARIATGTAAKASGKWGCDAELGKPPRTVALPVNSDESVPVADASGTCRGIPDRGARLSRAWESARADSPVEVCVVAGDRPEPPGTLRSDDTPRYHLTASYGPYAETDRLAYEKRHGAYTEQPGPGEAEAGRLVDGGHWASAACRDGSGPALFTVRDEGAWQADRSGSYDEHRKKPSAADLAYERAALKEFAERSARAHGCGAPELP